jgi:hypothetical protein
MELIISYYKEILMRLLEMSYIDNYQSSFSSYDETPLKKQKYIYNDIILKYNIIFIDYCNMTVLPYDLFENNKYYIDFHNNLSKCNDDNSIVSLFNKTFYFDTIFDEMSKNKQINYSNFIINKIKKNIQIN